MIAATSGRWKSPRNRRALLTCEAVLAEAVSQLGSSSYVPSLVQDEMLCVDFDFNRNLEQLKDLARGYHDRQPDLADLCLVRMSEMHPRHLVITVDADFRVYRRNKRETIPTLYPRTDKLNAMLLHGIFPPITTPFYPDGRVYFRKLEHNVERYSKTPVAGIVILGSTGEAIMLSDEERRQVLKTGSEACAHHKVLVAGTGAESALETLHLTDYAAELGYDAALVRTPFFYRSQMQPPNILAFYRTVADRSPLPLIIYNVPPFTNYDIPAELVVELSEHPNIIGIKESRGDVEKVRRMAQATRHIKRNATVTQTFDAVTPRMMKAAASSNGQGGELVQVAALGQDTESDMEQRASRASIPSSSVITVVGEKKTRQKEVGFQILVGTAQKLHPSLEAGAVGAVLAFACPAPTACYEVYAAWKEGDNNLATLKQERILQPAQRVASGLSVPGLKYAMDFNGYYGGPPRLPLLPLTADLKAEVERLLADIRN